MGLLFLIHHLHATPTIVSTHARARLMICHKEELFSQHPVAELSDIFSTVSNGNPFRETPFYVSRAV